MSEHEATDTEKAAQSLHHAAVVAFTALDTLAEMIDTTYGTDPQAGIGGLIEGIAGNLRRAADTFEPHLR